MTPDEGAASSELWDEICPNGDEEKGGRKFLLESRIRRTVKPRSGAATEVPQATAIIMPKSELPTRN